MSTHSNLSSIGHNTPFGSPRVSLLSHFAIARSTDWRCVRTVFASLWKSYSDDGGYHSVACGSVLRLDLD